MKWNEMKWNENEMKWNILLTLNSAVDTIGIINIDGNIEQETPHDKRRRPG
jgi:hypothetical protein